MGGLRRNKRVLGWLAAIALVSNVLAMALLARSTAAFTILDDILGPITLCTADGANTLPGGGSGPAEHSPSEHCPACVTVAQFALAVAIILAVIAFPPLPAVRLVPVWAGPPVLRLRLGGASPRAPPLSA